MDLVATYPNVYSIIDSLSVLRITIGKEDYADRRAHFGQEMVYFQGSIPDIPS